VVTDHPDWTDQNGEEASARNNPQRTGYRPGPSMVVIRNPSFPARIEARPERQSDLRLASLEREMGCANGMCQRRATDGRWYRSGGKFRRQSGVLSQRNEPFLIAGVASLLL
jgi:hypothetical protein